MVGHRLVTRNTLITALVSCAEPEGQSRARRFLTGLSADELEFIAEFLGSCILESSEDLSRATDCVQAHQGRMARASLRRTDHEIKMILLREYLQFRGGELPLSPGCGPAAA